MQKKAQTHIILRIADWTFGFLTVMAGIVMLVVLFGGYISPTTWVVPALVILAAPFVFLLNILTLLYWVIRWKMVGMCGSLFFMLFWIWSLGAFVQMRFWTPKVVEQDGTLKIMTYNVHNFVQFNGSSSSLDEILTFVETEKPDIICFQEYAIYSQNQLNLISSRLSDWPYSSNMFSESLNPEEVDCVVYSKIPISQPIPITTEGSTGGALQVDLFPSKGDTLRLYTCHLQTTAFNRVRNNKSIAEIIEHNDTKIVARKTVDALSANFRIRAVQADSIARIINESPYPTIITGDMNSVPLSYTYRQIKGGRGDAFRNAGEGYGYTYRPMKGLLRIDYVFYDTDRFECIDYQSPTKPMSDHNPVIVTLKNIKR